MATNALNVVHRALSSNGFEFEIHYAREALNFHGDFNDSSEFGVLRDRKNDTITEERLWVVLAIAQKRQAYLAIFPNIREVRKNERSKEESPQNASNEMLVCFIQKGVFETILDTQARLLASVKQSFLYAQEDETALELERLLKRTHEELTAYKKDAGYGSLLEMNAKHLLDYMEKEGAALRDLLIEDYLEDSGFQYQARCMRSAIQCLEIICSGNK